MTFAELVDVAELRKSFESFTALTGVPTAILDLDGTILIATGWQDICTRFHRVHPVTTARCLHSDTVLAGNLRKGEAFNVYRCGNGLVDVAVPIAIGGTHVANFFMGQFFFEPPDPAFFEGQAREFGFDPAAYREALRKVPIFTQENVRHIMAFLSRQVQLIGEMGLARRRVEDANADLRRSEQKYRRIFENAVEGLFLSSLEGRILDGNPAMVHILGYDSIEQLREDVSDSVVKLYARPEDRDDIVATLLRHGEVQGREVPLRCRDGRLTWVAISARLARDEAGRPQQFEGFLVDISERRRLEETILQVRKMESIGLLAGGVAHDFNNLLTPILGFTELLAADIPESSPQHGALQYIRQAAERGLDLTQRLLAFGRKQIIELRILDLGTVIQRFEAILRRTLREDIAIRLDLAPDVGVVRADAGQIEQVLLNLAVNAQDAMPVGGDLGIQVANVDLDAHYTRQHPEVLPGPYVRLSVSDTGVGMDADTMAHLFEPFFTTKEHGKGTGLGLSTVYGIVKQHGGSVAAYSEKGHGSVFHVYLPRMAGGDAAAALETPELEAFPRGTETILVVEDNEAVRELTRASLENLGYRVLATAEPRNSIDLARAHAGHVDLLLTDVVMPGMNGMELFEVLHREFAGLKVLFMSGYTSNVIGHHGVLDDGISFLQKPFSLRILATKVRLVLDSRSS
jgi:PAS domain S-box-containing protein